MLALGCAALLLGSCKGKPQQAQVSDPGLPCPATQLGEHQFPAFTEASAYVRNVATQAAAAYAEGRLTARTPLPCDDPRINIPMRPERTRVESCSAWMYDQSNPHLSARFSNGWLIVVDPQGVRRVSQEEFDAAHP